MRRILVALSDTHGGSRVGLLRPGTTLYQEDQVGDPEPWVPELTRTQQYLWSLYEEHVGAVVELAAGDEIVVIHCGDVTQGNRYPSLLVSDRMADQLIMPMALKVLRDGVSPGDMPAAFLRENIVYLNAAQIERLEISVPHTIRQKAVWLK